MIVAKLSSAQDHGRRILGHLSSGDAHGNADVRFFQCRGVIDTVSGHGNHIAVFLPGIHDPDLMFRRYPGIHGNFVNLFSQLLITQCIQLRAGERHIPLLINADGLRKGSGRHLVDRR